MYLLMVRKLFDWMEEHETYLNIARGIKGLKKPKGFKKDCLTADQIRKALNVIDTSTQEGLRNYAIFNLMARTGLRDIEIARAKVSDIKKQQGQTVLWVHGKGHHEKDSFVVLVSESLDPIEKWLQTLESVADETPLFMSLSVRNYGEHMTPGAVSKIIKTALRRAGIDSPRISAHSLRHSAITLAIAGGATFAQAQAMARHSKPETTMVYFHNFNRIRDAAEKCVRF